MKSKIFCISILVILWRPTLSFYNLCQTPKNVILNDEECTDLHFEVSDKTSSLGEVKLQLEENRLRIIPEAVSWTTTYLRISRQNFGDNLCSKLNTDEAQDSYCFVFTEENANETFVVEHKVEKLPDITARKFIFNFPDWNEVPIFLYIDQSDLSQLILKAQRLPSNSNSSHYKVEAYKEKHSNTNLQDFRIFTNLEEINYKFFTYNDAGIYFFVVSELNGNCTDSVCSKITTPKVLIERKGARVVIGIVGASFILPFILFVFHILTKKYPEENGSKIDDQLVVAYKFSSKKHNELVSILAALLGKLSKSSVEVIDLSKTNTKKFSQKICIDSLLYANRIVYVAPPKYDINPIEISKSLSEKNFYVLIFEHCSDKLPHIFDSKKVFKFDDFEGFLASLNITDSFDIPLYRDLVKKTEEAIVETENMETLPKIIVTESEPQENDSLISQKVVL